MIIILQRPLHCVLLTLCFMLLCRSAEPRAPSHCRAHSSLSKCMPIRPAAPRNSNAPEHHKPAMPASQPVTQCNPAFGDSSSPSSVSFLPDSNLVATIPTTTAAYAAFAAHSGGLQPDPITARLGDPASAMQASLGQVDEHLTTLQRCTSDCVGCHDCHAVQAALQAGTAQAVAIKAAVPESLQANLRNSPTTEEKPTALQSTEVQLCREVLQTLNMFDEVEQRRHKQAIKAAKRVQAIHEHQLLWAAKSKETKGACKTKVFA